ncbi:MAG: type II toxin-antitoxin system PemK/MazF family toxin [Myxococcales bacterium]|nr:type II toxin-antitoxin system PemK/MazF family toxin [Myxococcales bacterium]
MKRGELWWAELPARAGRRPVVLVSRDSSYAVRTSVTVVEVSRTVRAIPTEVPLGRREGLPSRCAANADHVVTIPKGWLQARIASLSTEKRAALDAALRFARGLA